ncbi:MAG: type II CAAX endopeptidase family protein [Lachnospiraceae bacterium]|nr:type II CAAX endopeptidase family protein [Lachnospiraceae bacterium]
MTYEEIKNSVPAGMPKKEKQRKPIDIKAVIGFFIGLMLLFSTVGAVIQLTFGMWGVAITELGFLVLSVLYVKRKHQRLKDVFPIKKPVWSAVLGTVLLWAGSYLFIMVGQALLLAYYPDYQPSSDSEVLMGSGMNWFLLFLIVAVLPPICEEAMHRGVIQYGLKERIRSPWPMAIVMGLFFGLFHMDPSKFFYTGILGGVMSWILFQTGNMVYSSLLHFIHNASQILLLRILYGTAVVPGASIIPCFSAGSGSAVPFGSAIVGWLQTLAGTSVSDPTVLGMSSLFYQAGILTIIYGLLIPPLMYLGNHLLLRDTAPRRHRLIPESPAERTHAKVILLVPMGCFLLAGFITAGIGLYMIS